MSKVAIQGNASGTGTLTIAAQNTNNNYTLTIPNATGTIITTAGGDAISGTTGTFSSTIQGGATISVGGATPSASGAGISFPATQSPSTDVNTLDDYEEGTWTPTITSSGGSLTAYTSSGRYTKVGNTVFVNGTFKVTTVGTASGYANVSGYPFTSVSAQSFNGSSREVGGTGNIYTATLVSSNTLGYVIANASGAVVWANNYQYDWNFTYQTS